MSPHCNLLKALVSVHIAYDTVMAHIQQFHQLASLEPTIVDLLNNSIPEVVCIVIKEFVYQMYAHKYV